MIDWLLSFNEIQTRLKISSYELQIIKNKYYYCYFRNLCVGIMIGIAICKFGVF
jgi:hypothetical protein